MGELGLDSFAVAAAMGASKVTRMLQPLRISLDFVIFENRQPLIGLGLGTALSSCIGQIAATWQGSATWRSQSRICVLYSACGQRRSSTLLVVLSADKQVRPHLEARNS